jgi:hypothetical protein
MRPAIGAFGFITLTNIALPLIPTETPGAPLSTLTKTNPVLEIPLTQSESEVVLQFAILNDPNSHDVANDVEVVAILPTCVNFKMDSGWRESLPSNTNGLDFEAKWFFRKLSQTTLLPCDTESLPVITLSKSQPHDPFAGRVPIFFIIRGKNVAYTRLGIWILVAEMPPGDNRVLPPRLVSSLQPQESTNGQIIAPYFINQ